MAKVTRSKLKKLQYKKKHTRKKAVSVSIPTKASKPPSDFRDISIFVHGEKKIGKTSLFAQEDGAFFLEFDPLQPFAIRQKHIPDWPHFIAYIDLLEEDPSDVKTLILDGVDIAYKLCFDWCCQKLVITHPHDEKDFGRSWSFIRDNFEKAMLRILNLEAISARFISHSKWQETETYTGNTVEKLVPFLTSQAEEVLGGRCDAWFAYMYSGKQRLLVVKGSETISAGHRVDGQFLTTDGDPLEEIDMGSGPKEAYQNLLKGFNNELESPKAVMVKTKKIKKLKLKRRR